MVTEALLLVFLSIDRDEMYSQSEVFLRMVLCLLHLRVCELILLICDDHLVEKLQSLVWCQLICGYIKKQKPNYLQDELIEFEKNEMQQCSVSTLIDHS